MVQVFGISGWSGSGKTTLLCRVLPELTARGIRVATAKHTHHRFALFEPDHPAQHWQAAGAREVLVASDARWGLMHDSADEAEPQLEDLLAKLVDVDLVLIEAFKRRAHDKMEVFRSDNGKSLFAKDDPSVVALATDCGRPAELPADRDIPVFDLDDTAAITNFIAMHCGLDDRASVPAPESS